MQRALQVSGILTALVGIALTVGNRPLSALVLTLTVGVGMINALWLERLLGRVLQPGKPRFNRGTVGLLAARFALWGLFGGGLFLLRRHIELWAVAAGVVIVLVGLATAGWTGGEPSPGKG